MKKVKLRNKYYEDEKLFSRLNIEIKDGITILVGCNGTGKTTALKQIEAQLSHDNIPFVSHSNLENGAKQMRDRAIHVGNYDFVAQVFCSSEGENIVNAMSQIAMQIGQKCRNNTADEFWVLLDAVDSGLSIDNIIDLKEFLRNTVIAENSEKTVYILISANEYELCRGENCLDVTNGKYISFNDYEEYRNFIIKSRDKKDKRYNK